MQSNGLGQRRSHQLQHLPKPLYGAEARIPAAGPHDRPELTDSDKTTGCGTFASEDDSNLSPQAKLAGWIDSMTVGWVVAGRESVELSDNFPETLTEVAATLSISVQILQAE